MAAAEALGVELILGTPCPVCSSCPRPLLSLAVPCRVVTLSNKTDAQEGAGLLLTAIWWLLLVTGVKHGDPLPPTAHQATIPKPPGHVEPCAPALLVQPLMWP